MIDITINDQAIMAALRNLQSSVTNLRPALKEIGETLSESTKKRFVTTTGPDGERWALNSVLSTLLGDKQGDRPLTDRGILGDTINYQLLGNDSVQIGSPMEYAAMQQFGGATAEFPHLWGDIPARPFLGISTEDESAILAIIRDHLESTF
ncbi:phage virion morphogenesis protein [Methylobacter sp. S3L5C]|uniref:phage virion morphogenesis protein n=1 Tax=Methylobacter sp. S3L5C TaxID=2839024 RepID=UPI001FAD4A6F|nr:phage virion morphogenesis protein [Methylobacter sp. S3L5C]UOA07629.1 phage virion morphogenesis protein [Methylobacter sp. S3L5C]